MIISSLYNLERFIQSSFKWMAIGLTFFCTLDLHAQIRSYRTGTRQYECHSHTGNVVESVSDKKVFSSVGLKASVSSYSDYYPFGMPLVGRNASSGAYRYGWQGMEKDDQVKGTGNFLSTLYRMYDARLGRWKSMDPKPNASNSSYISMGNNPVFYTDVLGDTIANYSSTGDYLGLLEVDKMGFTGQMTLEDESVRSFTFNDPGFDKKKVLKGDTKIEVVSNEDVNKIVDETKKQFTSSYKSKIGFTRKESASEYDLVDEVYTKIAKMDYLTKLELTEKKNTFFIMDDNNAFNNQDYGNYLWGATTAGIGIKLGIARLGAHYNSFLRSNKDNYGNKEYTPAKWYQFGKKLDSKADQRAIKKGHKSQAGRSAAKRGKDPKITKSKNVRFL